MKHCSLWALALLSLVIAGCGGQQQSSTMNEVGTSSGSSAPSGKKMTIGIVFDSGGRGDKSFNDSAWTGIERAKKEFNIIDKQIESKSDKDYEANLTAMAEGGCDLVFAIGMNMETALTKVAADYPRVKFAIVDATVKADNVRSLKFKEEEGSFLAGYIAGLVTKTNKLGFVGGKEIDLIKKFYYGFAAGAKTANPNIELLPGVYTGSWDNVDVAKAAATTLYSKGADVVYQAAGRAGLGVIDAAKSTKSVYAIGVDRDQDSLAPGSVLTSMVKRVDESVYQTIKDFHDARFTADERIYDLKANGVGITEMKYTKAIVGTANLAKIKAIEDKVKTGQIKVPSTEKEFTAYVPSGK